MRAPEPRTSYSTNRKSHFDFCRSFSIYAPPAEAEHHWSHEGWEIARSSPKSTDSIQQNLKVRGKLQTLHPRNFLFFNSLEDHTEIYPEDRSTKFEVLVFTKPAISNLIEETGIPAEEILFRNIGHDLGADLKRAIDDFFSLCQGENANQFAFECLGVELILKLLDRCPSTASSRLEKLSARGLYPSNVARAKKIIAQNISNSRFCLDDLAAEAGISKFHLIRCFKSQAGLSPIQYLTQVRLGLARMLLEKGRPVSEVSAAVGFHTFSAFRKARHRTIN